MIYGKLINHVAATRGVEEMGHFTPALYLHSWHPLTDPSLSPPD